MTDMISGCPLENAGKVPLHPLTKTSNIRTKFDFAVHLDVFHSLGNKAEALSTGEIMHHCFILPCIKLNIIHRIGHATESPQCWRVQLSEKQIMHKQRSQNLGERDSHSPAGVSAVSSSV